MKRILILFVMLCMLLTACGTDENTAEIISETESSVIETEAVNTRPFTESTESTVSESVTEPEITEPPICEIQTDNGIVRMIGNKDCGYLEVSSEWKYKDQSSHYSEIWEYDVNVIRYSDDLGNTIAMHACGESLYEEMDADWTEDNRHYSEVEKIESEGDGFKAYIIRAINGFDGDDCEVSWYIECEDEANRIINFYGDTEKIVDIADDIMQTYRLRKIPLEANELQTIGKEDYGYLNVSSAFKYQEPMVEEAPSIAYTDGSGNEISIRLYAEWGTDGQYIYSDESIDDIAERCYKSFKEFKDVKLEKLENSAPIAYRLTYIRTVRTDDGRGEVSYGDKHFSEWFFDFADGTKRSVTFSGNDEFVKSADRIIQTYRLRKIPPEANELQTIGNDEYGYLDTVYSLEYEPDDHGRAYMKYVDGYGNSITFKNSGRFGFGIKIESVDKLAEEYYELEKEYFGDMEMVRTEVDGHTAYKLTNSKMTAFDDVNYGYEYCADWIFERADGVNWSVIFTGDEEFVKMSDDIMQTYHLYK
ncbi:MAG: hypothetical protein NC320_01465 [Clostridium sp.]|nr:hypothetical protein [Clostridium sp.]MCM1547601.1 hypothetical protein [Ruminococcus sp.]